MYWCVPPSKSCTRHRNSSRCNFRVRFHPFTEEPTITWRKARRHDLKDLPSSSQDRWKFPGDMRRQMSIQSRAS
eukprot:9389291-Pyramimonas_sp.AAC.1